MAELVQPPTTRATAQDVRAIIEYDCGIEDLSPFIYAANELVTEICAGAAPGPGTVSQQPYTAFRLKQIEIWLAAHFLAIRSQRLQSEGIGGANASYAQQVGLNLSGTTYGQQATLLDTHGGLAWLDAHMSKGKRARVSIEYIGSPANPYVDFPWRYFRSVI